MWRKYSLPVRLEFIFAQIENSEERQSGIALDWISKEQHYCVMNKCLIFHVFMGENLLKLEGKKNNKAHRKGCKNDNVAFLNDSSWPFFVRSSFAVCFCVCARQRWIAYCVSSQILWIPSMIISFSSVVQRRPEAGLNNTRLLKLRGQRGATGQGLLFVGCICWRAHIQKHFAIFTSSKFIKVFLHSQ